MLTIPAPFSSGTIAFVTSTPTTVRGGSGTHVGIAVLRGALERAGYAVPLLAPAAGRRPWSYTAQSLAFNVDVRRRVRLLRPDLVVGFDHDGFLLGPCQVPGHVAAIKGVIADVLPYEPWQARATLSIYARWERIHVRRAPVVLTTSEYTRQRIAELYDIPASKIRVVPEPLDLALWQRVLGDAPERPRSGVTVLCVAHMYPRKSIGTLLLAMARTRTVYPDARLRVAGWGPQERDLRRLAARLGLDADGTVAFLGHIPLAALAAEYRNADIFCLPSRQEGFGIVYLEAMAAGLPVVACRTSAVPEVVHDDETGLLVPPLAPDALAAALARLIDDVALRRRLGDTGRRHVLNYAPDRIASAFMAAMS